jgi:hypothetical protein
MPVVTPPVRGPAFRTSVGDTAPAATSLLLHGADGSLWDLTRGSEGVLATTGIAGLGVPDFEMFTSQGALPGSIYTGQRTKERQFTVPVLVSSEVPADWYDVDRGLWNALDGLASLEFARANVSRMLDIRLAEAPDDSFYQDPSLRGMQQYTLPLVAYQPFYYDKQPTSITAKWYANPPAGTFWGGAFGNPYSRLPLTDFRTMQLLNPGDVAAWVTWIVQGPCDGIDLGVGEDRVIYSRRIEAGRQVVFVTDPATRSVRAQDGSSQFGGLIRQDFAPVPARSVRLLAPDPVNPGLGFQVTAQITPRWRRPW